MKDETIKEVIFLIMMCILCFIMVGLIIAMIMI